MLRPSPRGPSPLVRAVVKLVLLSAIMVFTVASGRRIVVSLSGVLDGLLLLVTVGVLLLVEEPFPTMQRLRRRLSGASASLRWLAVGVAGLLVALALVIRVSLWSALLSLPLVLVAITLLDRAPAPPAFHDAPREFLRRRMGALGIGAMAVLLFLVVDRGFGLAAALLLVVLPGYFAYNAQLLVDLTDKLALPAWSRRQEREADLLGVDLLVQAGYSPGAMVSLLEKLQAWEKGNTEPEQAFWDRLKQAAQRDAGEAVNVAYQGLIDAVSVSHLKTDERIEDTAQYLDRHDGERNLPGPSVAAWKRVATRGDVAEMMRNYDLAFSARKILAQGKAQAAYSYAVPAATGRTATDAYPNWILAHSAAALGRQREATDALERALRSPEPAPQIYEDVIVGYEKAGNITSALSWTDKASASSGGAPRWTPVKIRLLRKAGRTAEANTLMLSCSVNTPDWRRPCQDANQTPAGQARR